MNQDEVLVVEDDHMLAKLITRMLMANGASFIIAHNLEAALSLFEANKANITYILLDGSLTQRKPFEPLPDNPDTLPLAEKIAMADDFHGLVYPMSSMPNYMDILLKTLGKKGVFLGEGVDKNTIISEVIRQIKKS